MVKGSRGVAGGWLGVGGSLELSEKLKRISCHKKCPLLHRSIDITLTQRNFGYIIPLAIPNFLKKVYLAD